ncbi:MAG: hypothetical protein ACPL0B_01100 [Anaerolineales bacterium]
MSHNLPRQSDLEAINAYLDGEVTSEERQLFESRLKDDQELQELFHKLNRTRNLLRAQPNLRAPRNYTLKPQMVEGRKSIWELLTNRDKLLQTASAVLSLVFGIWFCLNILTVNQQKSLPMLAAPADVYESAPMAPYPEITALEPSISGSAAGESTGEPMMKVAPINPTAEGTPYPSIVGTMGLGGGEITTTQSITEAPLMELSPKSETPMVSAQNVEVSTSTPQEESGAALQTYPPQSFDQSQRALISPQAETRVLQTQTNPRWLFLQIGLAFLTIFFGGLTFYFYKQNG